MTNLIISRKAKVTLEGNMLTGNTFAVKEYIKSYLGGKWDGNAKAWIVDIAKVNDLIEKKAIAIDETPVVETKVVGNMGNWKNADGSLGEDY